MCSSGETVLGHFFPVLWSTESRAAAKDKHFSGFHTKKKNTLQLSSTFVCPLNFRRRHRAYFYFTPHYWKKKKPTHIFRVSPGCNVRRAKVQLNLSELQLCGAEQKPSKFHTAASQVVSVSAAFFSLTSIKTLAARVLLLLVETRHSKQEMKCNPVTEGQQNQADVHWRWMFMFVKIPLFSNSHLLCDQLSRGHWKH